MVSEPPLSSPEFRGIDAVDSLVWFASGTSVYAANATGGQIRWRVITSELIAPRAHIAVDFVHASEDGIARELRVAYYARDSVTGADAIEAVVLRMTDGRIVRRLSLPVTRTRATLSHIGACGTGGVALVSSDGTVNYARWSDGVTSVWRSQLIAQAGQPSEVSVFQPVFPSHLLVQSLTRNAIAVVNCAA